MHDQDSRHCVFLLLSASGFRPATMPEGQWTVQLTTVASTMSDIRAKFVTEALVLVICPVQA
ncbi:hypothetical protein, partial [Pseudomonas syringae group genomosp. 7]|uniref:hypothetical protein n=1 Tax=Pseudomonas syringae group genomosp. 7 TaxID=251699 RepID=UPI0037702F25